MMHRTFGTMTWIIALWAAAVSPHRADAANPAAKPQWLHEGLVLTFTWCAAVAPGVPSAYTEDQNGDRVDRSTGKRYTWSSRPGTSGSGWTQVRVSCIDGDRAVLSTTSFGDAGRLGNNEPVPQQGAAGTVVSVDDAGDYWMNPAA